MTHTLHRRGSAKDLEKDYVLLVFTARGFNREGSEEKMKQVWDVISRYEKDLQNFGNHNPDRSADTLYSMEELKKAKTIVWNGPLGYFEKKPFHTATMALSKVVGGVSSRKAFGVVGGGETVDALRQSGQIEHIDHVSTGGGAMLTYLAGKKLPGIEALK